MENRQNPNNLVLEDRYELLEIPAPISSLYTT